MTTSDLLGSSPDISSPKRSGSRVRSKKYPVPLYAKPTDLLAFDEKEQKAAGGLRYGRFVDGKPQAYFTRREIEEGALAGRGLEIVWVRYWSDAFFIQVQGSARIRFEDGSSMRLAYSAKTGLPYTAIGGVLVERGEVEKDKLSMQAILAWMRKDQKAARELMWENKSFVFFRAVGIAGARLGGAWRPNGAIDAIAKPRRRPLALGFRHAGLGR